MCGRVTSYTAAETLAEIFDVALAAELPEEERHWNLGPTTTLWGISEQRKHQPIATPSGASTSVSTPAAGSSHAGEPGGSSHAAGPGGPADTSDGPSSRMVLDGYRWGLIPSWSSSMSEGARFFNARAETVADKPAYRRAFRQRRLVVVVDGFYEWRHQPEESSAPTGELPGTRGAGGSRGAGVSRGTGGSRTKGRGEPYYFRRADGYPLTFAGLWEPWHNPADGSWVHSCTIITTEAGPDLADLHDRMPVILEPDQLAAWLTGPSEDTSLLRQAPPETLYRVPVDPKVGNVRNDDESLIEPVEPVEPVQSWGSATLF